MTGIMKNKLRQALEKYGEDEYIVQKNEIQKNLENNSFYQSISLQMCDYGVARAIFGIYGRILEESEDLNTYVFISRVPNMFDNEAFFVTYYEDSILHIAAYAKEGLFHQGIAKKETEKLLKKLGKR